MISNGNVESQSSIIVPARRSIIEYKRVAKYRILGFKGAVAEEYRVRRHV
jgi:hypothetical protein